VGISQTALVACHPFGPRLPAESVADAIACGLRDGGLLEPGICPLPGAAAGDDVRELLDALDFDARMRDARAVIVGAEQLRERTLAGSVTFEIATRARQRGVPAYAVTRANELDLFDARMLDLQLILQAGTRKALVSVGVELARLL
jgi:glycerate kinase